MFILQAIPWNNSTYSPPCFLPSKPGKKAGAPFLTGILFILCIFSQSTFAQNIVVDDSYTAQQLVNALVNSSCAQISNIQFTGSPAGSSSGYFTADDNFPFENGIILSTGFASSAEGPNTNVNSDGEFGWGGDTDLQDALSSVNTLNATALEFDFIPSTGHISFDFMFSSEEYTSWTTQDMCDFSDGFAFLLKEAGSSEPYQNLAVIPGTNIPVKVTTVRGDGFCPSANEGYFGAFNNASHPTNFNGQTVVMTAQADVVAGTQYHIKLVIADQGDTQYDSAIFLGGNSFSIGAELGEDRLLSTENPLCAGDTLELDATTPGAISYQWLKNDITIPGAINAQYTVIAEGEYTVKIQLSATCFAEGKIIVEYAPAASTGNYTLLQCDEDADGFATFNLDLADALVTVDTDNFGVYYFHSEADANANLNAITNIQTYQNTVLSEQLYARVFNNFGCYVISTLTLSTSTNALVAPTPLVNCDTDNAEDGIFYSDLTSKDQEILHNLPPGLDLHYYTTAENAMSAVNAISIPQSFQNTVAGGQTVYARLSAGSDCFGIVPLEIVIVAFGQEREPLQATLCSNSVVTLDAGSGYAAYHWNTEPVQITQTITVSQPGIYTVNITNQTGCQGVRTVEVIPSGPAIDAAVTINDFAGGLNSITVVAEGVGTYQYSLDGIIFQERNEFTNLASAEYTLYVMDLNGCGPVYTKTVYVMDHPKFFTPNGDGVNDVWRIPFMFNYPNAIVNVYDRHGKTVSAFKGSGAGWDGNLDGKALPASDYWFVIRLENGRTIRGHFSLIR